jgi:hypothetical protein
MSFYSQAIAVILILALIFILGVVWAVADALAQDERDYLPATQRPSKAFWKF